MTERGHQIDRFAQVTQAASSIGIILGIVVALVTIYNNLDSIKLSALTPLKDFIKEDEDVRKQIEAFLTTYDKAKLQTLVDKGGVEQAYLSDELSGLRSVGRHYEQMGALVRLNYIDFDLVYEIIPFPDAFWERTSEFRKEARTKNWENGKPLPDFWKNFSYLRDRYCQKRAKEGNPCN